MKLALQPRDLLVTAEELAKSNSSRRPRQSNLLRAASTTYYSLFHALAKNCADLVVGTRGANRSQSAWKQVYRALEHGAARAACENSGMLTKFPQGIQDFSNMFVAMQLKRHSADYDPDFRMTKSEVLSDIAAVRVATEDFVLVPIRDRRAFAVWLLFKNRPR